MGRYSEKNPNQSTIPAYGEVTSWALRSLIENLSGYGWTWEVCDRSSGSTVIPVAALTRTGKLTLRENLVVGTYTIGASSDRNVIQSSTGAHLSASDDNHAVYLNGSAVYCMKVSSTEYRTVFAAAFSQLSTKRAKENFKEISNDDAEKILKIPAYHFDYINGEKNQSGCFAEDVEPVYPEICTYQTDEESGETTLFGLDYSKFIPYIIKQLQVQNERINELESKIQELEKRK